MKDSQGIVLISPSAQVMPMTADTPAMRAARYTKHIERAGRTCYKSEHLITEDSAVDFVRMILRRGHLSVLEHCSVTFKIICDRGISHEMVRHRLCAFSQESTRYVKYDGDIEIIFEQGLLDKKCNMALMVKDAIENYREACRRGVSAQDARSILPTSLKTELVVTANFREWLHILTLRLAPAAHPQMRAVAWDIAEALFKECPAVFDTPEIRALYAGATKMKLRYSSDASLLLRLADSVE